MPISVLQEGKFHQTEMFPVNSCSLSVLPIMGFQDIKSATNIQSVGSQELKELKTMDMKEFKNDTGQAIQSLILSLPL